MPQTNRLGTVGPGIPGTIYSRYLVSADARSAESRHTVLECVVNSGDGWEGGTRRMLARLPRAREKGWEPD